MTTFNPYFYRVKVDRILDGDTFDAYFDLGFNITHKVRVRMVGIDAPETYRPKSLAEKAAGEMVKNFLTAMIDTYSDRLYCQSTNIDLYGRSEGIIYHLAADGSMVDINQAVASFMRDNNLTKESFK